MNDVKISEERKRGQAENGDRSGFDVLFHTEQGSALFLDLLAQGHMKTGAVPNGTKISVLYAVIMAIGTRAA